MLLLLHAPHHILCIASHRMDVKVRVYHVFDERCAAGADCVV